MYYRHQLDYDYPERSDEHMITVKHLRDTHFDENYNYIPSGAWYKFKRGVLWALLNTIVFPLCTIRHGVKIHGRKILRKHKKELKKGAITISNHVFMWDYICILNAIKPRLQFLPGWKTNFEGPNGPLIRWVGGIPVPTDNFRAMAKFNQAIDDVLSSGKWLHFFPEGSMWFFYPDVRPFKKAVFKYAVKHDKPIVPLGFSFRPRKGLYKLFGKTPLVDLNVGEPIYPDKTLSLAEATAKLHETAYHVVQGLCGIPPGDPTYNVNQNISEYKKTM